MVSVTLAMPSTCAKLQFFLQFWDWNPPLNVAFGSKSVEHCGVVEEIQSSAGHITPYLAFLVKSIVNCLPTSKPKSWPLQYCGGGGDQ